MIKIENVVLPSPAQWEAVIRGARNPMNSWDKMDSYSTYIVDEDTLETADFEYFIGENDLNLLNRLSKAGTDHRKFMRMIPVIVDITAPDYWFKEFSTYRIGVTENSTSTMHRIHSKEFTLDDFSTEHLHEHNIGVGLKLIIDLLNANRQAYIATKDKEYWWQMIQLLPMSYNYRRTVSLNYEVLSNMYHSRKTHKLDEWRTFTDWIEDLPYSELITQNKANKSE